MMVFAAVISLFLGAVVLIYIYQLLKIKRKIPGPLPLPIVGNALEFNSKPEDTHKALIRLSNQYGKIFQVWIGPVLCFTVCLDSKLIEKILVSSKNIDKLKQVYSTLDPWLGDGLLLSTGSHWRKHRKLLTPGFHFTILEEALDKFVSATNKLINNLAKHVDGDDFDIYPYITLCGLDIICETAMGIEINAQENADSEYVRAVRDICTSIFKRVFSVVGKNDFVFYNLTSDGAIYKKSLRVLHTLTERVIKERREQLLNEQNSKSETDSTDGKKYKAFLDILLQSTIDGEPLTDMEIRNEVDTFMFEGHDTTASGIAFTLYLLSQHPEVQTKVFNEIEEVLGGKDVITISDLNNMPYLELVVKESMRLFPPVPMVGRTLSEPIEHDGVVYEAGRNFTLFIYQMHRDPNIFTNPDEFQPERFIDLSSNKNFFSYIPFSAGPRNCIGQKFAMYEMKSTISKLLQAYELLPADKNYNISVALAIITKSINGILLKIKKRTK